LFVCSPHPPTSNYAGHTPAAIADAGLATVPYPDGYTLRHVQVVTRHGARAPLVALPAGLEVPWWCAGTTLVAETGLLRAQALVVPARHRKRCAGMAHVNMMTRHVRRASATGEASALPGNCTLGQITDRGLEEMVAVGAVLRAHYVNRVKYLDAFMAVDAPAAVQVRSTDTSRTRATAEAVTRGLYPAAMRPRGERASVKIEFVTAEDEVAYPNARRCPALRGVVERLALEQRDTSRTVATMGQPIADTIARATEALRKLFSPANPPSVQTMASILECRDAHGLPLPPGIDADLAADLAVAAGAQLNATVSDREYVTLGIGEFLHELAENAFETVQGATMPPLMYYSAHDTTLATLLGALGTFDAHWPPFGSQLILELFRREEGQSDHFRIIYNGRVLRPRGCSDDMCNIQVLRDTAERFSLRATGLSCRRETEHNNLLGMLA
jgi:hypothetical protein